MTLDLTNLLDIAEQAARAAGKQLRARGHGMTDAVAVDKHDIKIAADLRAEETIRGHLSDSGISQILGEENGWRENAGNQSDFWVVDPLDGTANYARDIPLCCVSIGLVLERRIALGVVFDFNRDEIFTGAVGQGASRNGQPIKVSGTAAPDQAVLTTGLPPARDHSQDSLETFARRAGDFRKVRMLGSAALSLAFVACGRADAYHEESIMFWDVAAGLALVEAAGGVTHWRGSGWSDPLNVSAAGSQTLATYLEVQHG